MSGQFMMIDNMPVEINGEKNLLDLIRKTGIEAARHSAIIPNYPYTAPAGCVWWKTAEAVWKRLALRRRVRGWKSIPIRQSFGNIAR